MFPINNIDHFQGHSKIFSIFCASCMVIDSFQKKSVIKCSSDNVFPEPSLSDWKKVRFCLDFQKKPSVQQKAEFQNLASTKADWQPCLQRLVAKCGSRLFYYWPLLRNNTPATNLQRLTLSGGSGHFAHVTVECRHIGMVKQRDSDCWKQ